MRKIVIAALVVASGLVPATASADRTHSVARSQSEKAHAIRVANHHRHLASIQARNIAAMERDIARAEAARNAARQAQYDATR